MAKVVSAPSDDSESDATRIAGVPVLGRDAALLQIRKAQNLANQVNLKFWTGTDEGGPLDRPPEGCLQRRPVSDVLTPSPDLDSLSQPLNSDALAS